MNKKWQICECDKEKIENIKNKYNLNSLLATILVNKNIIDKEKIRLFLEPNRNDFYDPYLINDMDIATDRIIKAINNQEKVIIYGDYDVDGITSITVLKSFLKDVGLQASYYIPNRLEEGYGLNKDAINKIAEQGYTLMITVDCGITAIEEVEYANSLGIETIITDHHEPGEELPNVLAVIDNKRKDSKYPFRELAGVGVAFKVSQALSQKLNLKEETYLKYLDIVCVGTISDIVPLVDENRVITKLGMLLVKQTKNLGLRSILNSSGYRQINSMAISFGVAPRINACGRLGDAEEALKLLLSTDIYEVNELTNKLNEHNRQRQEIEKSISKEAIEKIENEKLNENRTIVVGGKNWHHGVIGIVSSKITEKYFKPSILLSLEENGIAKGSGRSIPGFDLHEALMKCEDLLDKFGGHSMAVGLTLKQENLSEFYKRFEDFAKESKIEEIVPIINVDAKIELSDINKKVIEDLKQLEPFGEANKMPIFALKNVKIDSIRSLSDGKHLKLTLREKNQVISAIGFNIGNLVNEYKIGDRIDIAGTLEINTYNGMESLQINIKDVKKSI